VRVSHVFAGIATADLESAVAWYERLFGRPPDNRPHEQEVVWQLAETGLIYVVADPERAGHGLLTLIIDDLGTELAALEQRGISTGPIETLGSGARTIALRDPDGNIVKLGQVRTPR
jgi:catechol 2,3-dioxygenase-like lactoylglutathione lyase family enzyme